MDLFDNDDLLRAELDKHMNLEWSDEYRDYIATAYMVQWRFGAKYDNKTEQVLSDLYREIGDFVLGEEIPEERVLQGGEYTLSEDLEYELLMRNLDE